MGKIKLIIGKASKSKTPEYEKKLDLPFDDGSGFPNDYDKPTGRKLVWFNTYATLDLCKLGYQEDALNTLISDTFAKAKLESKTVHWFYSGDEETKKDLYGDGFWPVPVKDVVEVINKLDDEAMSYRRIRWAKALLKSMVDDDLEVMFFGN